MAVTLCNWVWRFLIAGVLLLAAYSKFSQGISYLPPETIYDRFVALSPWRHYSILAAEAIIALWVLSSVKARWSSIAAGLLFAAFTAILSAELVRTNPDSCGCGIRQVFPDGDPRVDLWHGIMRDVLLMIGCAWLWLMGEPEVAKTQIPQTSSSPPQTSETSAS